MTKLSEDDIALAGEFVLGLLDAAGEATLASSARLRAAPERGDTGPEVLVYFGILGACHGLYMLRKRRKMRGK